MPRFFYFKYHTHHINRMMLMEGLHSQMKHHYHKQYGGREYLTICKAHAFCHTQREQVKKRQKKDHKLSLVVLVATRGLEPRTS